jgi:acetyl-CoA carboxylase biotin carboxyl carrier protein
MAESAEFMQQVFKETKELIRSMEGTATSKVRIAVSGIEIEVKRDGEAFTTTAVPMSSSMSAGGGTATPAANAGGMPVVAPLVGVFYRSSSPGSKPFVEVGDTVERGQTIGIVEAMKVMNEVQSDYRGVVAEILVENGEAVQYEQRLMLINVG